MMFDRFYRPRREADLVQWQADGVVTPQAAAAIRGTLPPIGTGINIAVVVAIVGGLLIAAAFLAFVASNWTVIGRPMRFVMLAAGMAAAHGRVDYGINCGTNYQSFCASLRVRYNLEKYFVPEGEGPKLEQDLPERRKVTVVAAVLPSGRAAIKRLLVDGKPLYDESWF